ncbi:hypothetical protein EW026_g1296 [Hermanssonia centrifuga]|uniref:RRM domain-containing protein n=1 Tax=Hermanssonia centrifuga TaxID=98765 RepID=A0A4S4KRW1_9APHY|nr:hypothetical protein EW026_g1296 [Hermanssonia centrifuga]
MGPTTNGGGISIPTNDAPMSGTGPKAITLLGGQAEAAALVLGTETEAAVKKAQVMYDPHTRESRGFGFVTMESGEEADAAITALNGTDLMGKNMLARRGRARTPTPGRYYGPPKRSEHERPYDPRPYDSRYSRGGGGGGGGGGRGGHDDYPPPRARRAAYDDDYRGGGRDYDRGSYRDYDRGNDRGYDRRGGGGGGGGYDDRRY